MARVYQALYIIAVHKLSITSEPVNLNLDRDTVVVRVFATNDCYLAIRKDAVATTDDIFCPAGIIQFFSINKTDSFSVISADAYSGTLHLIEGV